MPIPSLATAPAWDAGLNQSCRAEIEAFVLAGPVGTAHMCRANGRSLLLVHVSKGEVEAFPLTEAELRDCFTSGDMSETEGNLRTKIEKYVRRYMGYATQFARPNTTFRVPLGDQPLLMCVTAKGPGDDYLDLSALAQRVEGGGLHALTYAQRSTCGLSHSGDTNGDSGRPLLHTISVSNRDEASRVKAVSVLLAGYQKPLLDQTFVRQTPVLIVLDHENSVVFMIPINLSPAVLGRRTRQVHLATMRVDGDYAELTVLANPPSADGVGLGDVGPITLNTFNMGQAMADSVRTTDRAVRGGAAADRVARGGAAAARVARGGAARVAVTTTEDNVPEHLRVEEHHPPPAYEDGAGPATSSMPPPPPDYCFATHRGDTMLVQNGLPRAVARDIYKAVFASTKTPTRILGFGNSITDGHDPSYKGVVFPVGCDAPLQGLPVLNGLSPEATIGTEPLVVVCGAMSPNLMTTPTAKLNHAVFVVVPSGFDATKVTDSLDKMDVTALCAAGPCAPVLVWVDGAFYVYRSIKAHAPLFGGVDCKYGDKVKPDWYAWHTSHLPWPRHTHPSDRDVWFDGAMCRYTELPVNENLMSHARDVATQVAVLLPSSELQAWKTVVLKRMDDMIEEAVLRESEGAVRIRAELQALLSAEVRDDEAVAMAYRRMRTAQGALKGVRARINREMRDALTAILEVASTGGFTRTKAKAKENTPSVKQQMRVDGIQANIEAATNGDPVQDVYERLGAEDGQDGMVLCIPMAGLDNTMLRLLATKEFTLKRSELGPAMLSLPLDDRTKVLPALTGAALLEVARDITSHPLGGIMVPLGHEGVRACTSTLMVPITGDMIRVEDPGKLTWTTVSTEVGTPTNIWRILFRDSVSKAYNKNHPAVSLSAGSPEIGMLLIHTLLSAMNELAATMSEPLDTDSSMVQVMRGLMYHALTTMASGENTLCGAYQLVYHHDVHLVIPPPEHWWVYAAMLRVYRFTGWDPSGVRFKAAQVVARLVYNKILDGPIKAMNTEIKKAPAKTDRTPNWYQGLRLVCSVIMTAAVDPDKVNVDTFRRLLEMLPEDDVMIKVTDGTRRLVNFVKRVASEQCAIQSEGKFTIEFWRALCVACTAHNKYCEAYRKGTFSQDIDGATVNRNRLMIVGFGASVEAACAALRRIKKAPAATAAAAATPATPKTRRKTTGARAGVTVPLASVAPEMDEAKLMACVALEADKAVHACVAGYILARNVIKARPGEEPTTISSIHLPWTRFNAENRASRWKGRDSIADDVVIKDEEVEDRFVMEMTQVMGEDAIAGRFRAVVAVEDVPPHPAGEWAMTPLEPLVLGVATMTVSGSHLPLSVVEVFEALGVPSADESLRAMFVVMLSNARKPFHECIDSGARVLVG